MRSSRPWARSIWSSPRARLRPATQWLVVRNDVVSILGSDGGRYFWKNGGEAAFDPGFGKFVSSELDKADRPYDMARMTAAS